MRWGWICPLGTIPSLLEYYSLSGLFIGFRDSYAYVFSLPLLSHPTLELPKWRGHIGFVDKRCRHVYVGGWVGALFLEKGGSLFWAHRCLLFVNHFPPLPKGKAFSNVTARGLFLPSWGSIFQCTQRRTLLFGSGLISRFCRKYVSSLTATWPTQSGFLEPCGSSWHSCGLIVPGSSGEGSLTRAGRTFILSQRTSEV